MSNDSDTIEVLRIKLGCYIVLGSIVALLAALLIIVRSQTGVTEMVALLGSITTFLGAVVGVFFGVNSSGSARAQNATSAADINQTAGRMADATKSLNDTAKSTVDLSHSLLRATFAASDAADTTLGAMATAASPAEPDTTDMLAGDPDDRPTALLVPPLPASAFAAFVAADIVHVAAPQPPDVLFGTRVLAVAAAEAAADVSRDHDRARVSEYLRLLGLDFLDQKGNPTRYCAAGLTWSACRAFCDLNAIAYDDSNRLLVFRGVLSDIRSHYFKPSASCQAIMEDAKSRKTWLAKDQPPKAGYIVLYNWEGGLHAEHIGWVESLSGGALDTIEFNTTATSGPNQGNGGSVARKTRALKFVLGYVRTY